MKRIRFYEDDAETFIPIRKGLNPKRQVPVDEEFTRKDKKRDVRRNKRNYDFFESTGKQ